MSKSFSAQIGVWVAKTEARAQAAYRRSVELLAEEMVRTKPQGGRVPFQTGSLARSLLASTQGALKISNGPFIGSNVGAVTATLSLKQPIWLGYQAAYARRQNYGFVGADKLGRIYSQPGSYFVEGAIAAWPHLVSQAAAEIKAYARSG